MGNSKSKTKSKSTKSSTFGDNYKTFEQLQEGLKKAGLESSRLIIGIDYTKSNTWKGQESFGGRSLHHLSDYQYNPYQQVIQLIADTLAPFDDDNLIPVYGFGDSKTKDQAVFSFYPHDQPCQGLAGVFERYAAITNKVKLSGPTCFAPIIHKAIQLVKATGEYHILLIIADGQVTRSNKTREAIVEASHYPLSIIMVGVGDGPWEEMIRYDDQLHYRLFDNFQFVAFHQVMAQRHLENPALEFARLALMEIPEQYQAITKLGLLQKKSTSPINQPSEIYYPELPAQYSQPVQPYSQPVQPYSQPVQPYSQPAQYSQPVQLTQYDQPVQQSAQEPPPNYFQAIASLSAKKRAAQAQGQTQVQTPSAPAAPEPSAPPYD